MLGAGITRARFPEKSLFVEDIGSMFMILLIGLPTILLQYYVAKSLLAGDSLGLVIYALVALCCAAASVNMIASSDLISPVSTRQHRL